jgi:hypothetical protein
VAPPPQRTVYVEEERWHHDNGKHKGWYKQRGEDDDDQGEHGHGKHRH